MKKIGFGLFIGICIIISTMIMNIFFYSPIGDNVILGIVFSIAISLVISVASQLWLNKNTHQHLLYDPLTGLHNRQYILDKVNDSLQKGEVGTIFYINYDRFNRINHALGQEIGDKFLKKVSKDLTSLNIEQSEISRIAADEFCIFIRGVEDDGPIYENLEMILDLLNSRVALEEFEFQFSGRIGVSYLSKHGKNGKEVIDNAKMAMKEAKLSDNRIGFFSETIQEQALEALTIEAGLKHAIQNGELILHYQPQVEVDGEQIKGVEALVRWNHPRLGLIPPDKFIKTAELTGDICLLGNWVLKEACLQLNEWNKLRLTDLGISVNISLSQLRSKDFINDLRHILIETNTPPHKLTLEITESMAMNFDRIIPILFQIKDMGVKIAVDDFGTGYSSLSYLTKLPFDYIKIDRMFVQDIDENHNSLAIIESIIAMANQLGAVTVAEGVENHYQYELLKDRKCEKIQGYWISKPAEPHVIYEKFLDEKALA